MTRGWILMVGLTLVMVQPTWGTQRVSEGQVVLSDKQTRLLATMRSRVEAAGRHGFEGALPADTAWARRQIADSQRLQRLQQTMARQQAEAHPGEAVAVSAGHTIARAPDAGRLETLSRWRASEQTSVPIQIRLTVAGPRIPALTRLTAEGLAIQAAQGCRACHRK